MRTTMERMKENEIFTVIIAEGLKQKIQAPRGFKAMAFAMPVHAIALPLSCV